MSLLLVAAMAAQVVPIAQIDLAAPDLYVSQAGRAGVEAGTVTAMVCLDLPKRSRKFRTACLTKDEWQAAAKRTAERGRRALTPEAINGLPYSYGPSQSTGYEATGPR